MNEFFSNWNTTQCSNEESKLLTIFQSMWFATSFHLSSPQTWYFIEKNVIGQPDVSHDVISRSTEVTFVDFRSILFAGIIGAETHIYKKVSMIDGIMFGFFFFLLFFRIAEASKDLVLFNLNCIK